MPFLAGKLLFIQVPKSGSQSITEALKKTTTKDKIERIKLGNSHMTLKELISKNYLDMKLLTTFGVARNPYIRCVSMYKHFKSKTKLEKHYGQNWKRVKNQCFKDLVTFLEEFDYRWGNNGCSIRTPQVEWIKGCDFRGKIEDIDSIQRFIAEHTGITPDIPYINAQNLSSSFYKSYYNADAKKTVEKFFGNDIEEFGYTFDEPVFFSSQPSRKHIISTHEKKSLNWKERAFGNSNAAD